MCPFTPKKGQTYTVAELTNSGSYANAANLKWSSTNSSVAAVAKGSSNKAVTDFTSEQKKLADVNGDGTVNVIDSTEIQKRINR